MALFLLFVFSPSPTPGSFTINFGLSPLQDNFFGQEEARGGKEAGEEKQQEDGFLPQFVLFFLTLSHILLVRFMPGQ